MATHYQNDISPLILSSSNANPQGHIPLFFHPHQGSQASSVNRSRIYSHQQQNRKNQVNNQPPFPSSRDQNLERLRNKKLGPKLKQSNGIMNQPHQYLPKKYTFKNDSSINMQEQTCLFGPCCSIVRETQREVYLSPTQLISTGYFYKNIKSQPKSLKFQKQSHPASIAQRSFFGDTSNVIQ